MVRREQIKLSAFLAVTLPKLAAMSLRLLPLRLVEAPREHLLSVPSLPRPPYAYAFRSLPPHFPDKLQLQVRQRRSRPTLVSVGNEELQVSEGEGQEVRQEQEASPGDLEYIRQINRVKLTIMIEDPREVERKRLLGIDPDEVTRDDLVSALEDVNEGRIPENRLALRLLAEEMLQWPNLEVEVTKQTSGKSLYARATDTGVDPREAAKRLNMDWDSAADIETDDEIDEVPVPPAVGYGALYLVTAFPLIIGAAVVLILFYNSLQ